MKRKILKCVLSALMIVTCITAFGQQNAKAAKARKDLSVAKSDSAADYKEFKKNADIKIAENQKKIVELKAKKSDESKEVKEKYDKQVLALEEKNKELKKRSESASGTKTSMWTDFKRGFNKDMTALGQSIMDVQVGTK